MTYREIVWNVPENLYNEMIQIQKEMYYPDVHALISQVIQRYLSEIRNENWRREFRHLQKQVQSSGSFNLGKIKEGAVFKPVPAHLRQSIHQRRESYETFASRIRRFILHTDKLFSWFFRRSFTA